MPKPNFEALHLNARQLAARIGGGSITRQYGFGCSFFKPLIQEHRMTKDASTISKVAASLDDENDWPLMDYLQRRTIHGLWTPKQFKEFKTDVLLGCYLFKWKQYRLVEQYTCGPLIELFKEDLFEEDKEKNLKAASLDDLDTHYITSCIQTFCKYCAFLFANKKNSAYSAASEQLGHLIQVEIDDVLYPKNNNFFI